MEIEYVGSEVCVVGEGLVGANNHIIQSAVCLPTERILFRFKNFLLTSDERTNEKTTLELKHALLTLIKQLKGSISFTPTHLIYFTLLILLVVTGKLSVEIGLYPDLWVLLCLC